MSKFKLGELAIIVGRPSSQRTAVYLGEVVEVICVSHWWNPIKSCGQKWDYEIRHD